MNNIPLTNGLFYYFSKHQTKSEAENVAKKLGKKKNQYKIVTKQITQNKSFLDKIFNIKAKSKNLYILYLK